MKGERAPEYDLQGLNIGSGVDLKQHRGFGTGWCSEGNRGTEVTPRHGRAPQNQGTGHKTALKSEMLHQPKIAGFDSEPPGNGHTWKSRLFREPF